MAVTISKRYLGPEMVRNEVTECEWSINLSVLQCWGPHCYWPTFLWQVKSFSTPFLPLLSLSGFSSLYCSSSSTFFSLFHWLSRALALPLSLARCLCQMSWLSAPSFLLPQSLSLSLSKTAAGSSLILHTSTLDSIPPFSLTQTLSLSPWSIPLSERC